MIVKNLTRKSGSGQLVRYIFRYILKPEKQLPAEKSDTKARSNKTFIIQHNVRSRDIPGMIKEFKQNEANRIYKRKNQVTVHHTIVSFGVKDRKKITDKTLRDMARKYIQLRSPNSLYVGTKHEDREHVHLHLAMSGTQINGRSNRISKAEFAKLKIQLQEYQQEKYKELTNSLLRHGKSKELKQIQAYSYGRASQKEKLVQFLDTAFEKSKSIDQFLNRLKAQGYQPYYRGTDKRLTGVQQEGGRRFRLNRLGYTPDRIAELNSSQAKEQEELRQLQEIRSRSEEREEGREIEMENTQEEDDTEEENED